MARARSDLSDVKVVGGDAEIVFPEEDAVLEGGGGVGVHFVVEPLVADQVGGCAVEFADAGEVEAEDAGRAPGVSGGVDGEDEFGRGGAFDRADHAVVEGGVGERAKVGRQTGPELFEVGGVGVAGGAPNDVEVFCEFLG